MLRIIEEGIIIYTHESVFEGQYKVLPDLRPDPIPKEGYNDDD